jgi:hypothetical protein
MALTVSTVRKGVVGDMRYSIVDVTFDASYPTGGESVTPADFGFTTDIFHVDGGVSDTGIVVGFIDSTSKLKAYWVDTTVDGAGMAEVVDTTNLSTADVRLFALGF